MSEPVQKPEIEDVLSSIRRLVSGEDRPKEPEPPADSAPTTERFVLTPALRVADAPGVDAGRSAPEQRVPDAAQASVEPASDPVPEPAGTPAEAPEPEPAPQAMAEEPAPVEPEPVAEEAEAPVDESEAPMAEDVTVPLVQPVGEGGNVAPLRPFQPGIAPDGLEAELEQAAGGDGDLSRLRAALDQEGDDATEVRGEADGASLLPSSELKAKIASLAGAVERSRVAWPAQPGGVNTPEKGATERPAPITLAPEARVDNAAAVPAPVPEADPVDDEDYDGPDGDDDYDDDDAAFIDEETLREMVVEIVRDELRGALGTRITRNVRKLVRQEIQRLLATQGIDKPD